MLLGSANATALLLPDSAWQEEGGFANRSRGNITRPFLFVGVLSTPHSFERRHAVRETWMQTASEEVAVRFVMYKVQPYRWTFRCTGYFCILMPCSHHTTKHSGLHSVDDI